MELGQDKGIFGSDGKWRVTERGEYNIHVLLWRWFFFFFVK